MPSVTRMSPTIRLDTRWVCPATMASTVVSPSASAMATIGPSHGTAAAVPSTALVPFAVPSWITTICTSTPRAAAASTPRRSVRPPGRNFRPAVLPADDEFRAWSPAPAPITPTRTPLTRKTVDGVTQSGAFPVASSTMLVARNGKFGLLLLREEPVEAVVELVVAVGRRVQAPGVLDVDGRGILQQAGVRR